jgi:hypothetical protein
LPNRIRLAVAAVLAAGIAGGIAAAYAPSVADLDAAARATGNRRDVAERIGRAIFTTRWPAEVNQISANSLDGHLIVGVRLWGVKFHQSMTRDDFIAEVVALVERTFAAAPATEEIDLWASIPMGIGKGVVVSGDLAKPTSRTVFSVTVRNGESSSSLRARIGGSGDGVFWDSSWADAALRASK